MILLTSVLFSYKLITRCWNQEIQFSRKSSINFYRKVRLKKFQKKLFVSFPSMYFPIFKRSSLRKVLNFCLPFKQLKYAYYLVHFEFFYRDIRSLEILSNNDLWKQKLWKQYCRHSDNIIKNNNKNLSKKELTVLRNLSKNKGTVISKMWQR